MTHRWWYESRSDAIVNVMLGVPLGFGLLGYLRSGRSEWLGDILVGAFKDFGPTVNGVATNPLDVYDVSDCLNPVLLSGTYDTAGQA